MDAEKKRKPRNIKLYGKDRKTIEKKIEQSSRELAEDLTQRDRKLIHARMHTRNIFYIIFVFVLFCIHRFRRIK